MVNFPYRKRCPFTPGAKLLSWTPNDTEKLLSNDTAFPEGKRAGRKTIGGK